MAGTRTAEKLALRPARVDGIETGIVADHQNSVFGHGEIEFQRGDADLKRAGESLDRILRREAAGSAMTLQIKCACAAGSEHGRRDECDVSVRHGRPAGADGNI